jgi:hypothetical protein
VIERIAESWVCSTAPAFLERSRSREAATASASTLAPEANRAWSLRVKV